MQVSLKKKDVLTAEEFFLEQRRLVIRLTDSCGRWVHFKTYAQDLDDSNYYIKTRGVYKGGTIATYRLPRALGSLDDLYEVVGENFPRLVRNIIERDRDVISKIARFKKDG